MPPETPRTPHQPGNRPRPRVQSPAAQEATRSMQKVDLSDHLDLRLVVGIRTAVYRITKKDSELFFRAFVVSDEPVVIITGQEGRFEEYQLLYPGENVNYRVTPPNPQKRYPLARLYRKKDLANQAASRAAKALVDETAPA
jgi:hypothetical protein